MAGGAPAGIIKLPGDELCCTTSTIINIMTRRGKRRTTPKGTDIFELPLSKIRLLKKENLSRGGNLDFSLSDSYKEGRLGDEGNPFMMFRRSPIVDGFSLIRNRSRQRNDEWQH